MKNKALKQSKPFDEIYTPSNAIDYIKPFLIPGSTIFEPCYGTGNLVKHFSSMGFKIIGNENIDYFNNDIKTSDYDYLITNPPYSNKRKFIKHAIDLNVPFAFLVPLTTLGGKEAHSLFKDSNIQIIIPSKRIQFLENKNGVWFHVIWITRKLNLKNDITFMEI